MEYFDLTNELEKIDLKSEVLAIIDLDILEREQARNRISKKYNIRKPIIDRFISELEKREKAGGTSEVVTEVEPYEEEELERNFIIQPPITDATPEALDKILNGQHGFFIANSTEQGLANSLIGGMYSEKGNNFDVLLKGFNAEWHSSSRVTRDGFSGKPHGGVLCISQDGLI